MKLGICLNMIAAGADATGREWIPRVAEMGVDYAEIPLAQSMQLSENEFEDTLLRPMKDANLSCLSCNNFFPASCRLTGPEADLGAALSYAAAALDRAAQLGAPRVVFGSSGARNRPNGFSRADALDQLAELTDQLGDLARERGITIVLETPNYLESNVLNRLDETRALMLRVNHPAVRMLVDSFHMWMVDDPLSCITDIGGDLRHVHIARSLARGLPAEGDDSP